MIMDTEKCPNVFQIHDHLLRLAMFVRYGTDDTQENDCIMLEIKHSEKASSQ